MDQASNAYSLYIPRVALALSSSGSSNKSTSRYKESAQKRSKLNGEISETSGESESEGIYGSSIQNYGGLRANRNRMYNVHKVPKRGSQSSESSTSNHSNYDVNSLLLSVKNLENFNKSSEQHEQKVMNFHSDFNPNIIMKRSYYDNYTITHEINKYPIYEYRSKMLQNIRNISANNLPALTSKPDKEVDAISTTSSMTNTNFTVISFNDSHQRLNKSKAICRRSQQITILVFIMTVLFIIGITCMLVLMDMRNQKMPR